MAKSSRNACAKQKNTPTSRCFVWVHRKLAGLEHIENCHGDAILNPIFISRCCLFVPLARPCGAVSVYVTAVKLPEVNGVPAHSPLGSSTSELSDFLGKTTNMLNAVVPSDGHISRRASVWFTHSVISCTHTSESCVAHDSAYSRLACVRKRNNFMQSAKRRHNHIVLRPIIKILQFD